MLIDFTLAIIALISLVVSLRIVARKLPQLAHVDVHGVPDRQQARIKRQILEEKFRRDIQSFWSTFKTMVLSTAAKRVTALFSGLYRKLKELEHEYFIARKKDLSTHITRSRSIDELLSAARDHIAVKELDRAEQTLLECLKVEEHSIRVYMLLSQVYREQGEYDHARETLEFVVKLTESRDPSVFGSLASLAFMRGDLAGAQEGYVRSIALDPENHRFHLELAEVLIATGEVEKAISEANKALKLAPNNPKILDFLTENSILLRDKRSAQKFLAKLVEVNPENGKIQSFRSRIAELG